MVKPTLRRGFFLSNKLNTTVMQDWSCRQEVDCLALHKDSKQEGGKANDLKLPLKLRLQHTVSLLLFFRFVLELYFEALHIIQPTSTYVLIKNPQTMLCTVTVPGWCSLRSISSSQFLSKPPTPPSGFNIKASG